MRATISAFEKTGIRGTIVPSLRDQNFLELVSAGRRGKKPTTGADSELWKARMLPVLAQLGNSSTLSNLMLGPSSPQNCSDSLLQDVMIMAERYDLGIHTHLLETIVERWGGGKLYKGGIVRRIDKLGLLSPRLSVAHGVWLDAQEMDILARSGASVVHNPASNLKLGSGIAPVTKLIQRGVNVALGTDGGDTSDSYSIFEQMRLAAFLSRLNNQNPDHWLTALDVLRMGTLNGANAVPAWRGKIGRIKTGYRADLVILRPHLGLYPLNDVVHQLVYCESGRSVDTVLVDGNVVVKNGRLVNASEESLIDEVKPISNAMYKTYTRSKRAAEETDTVIQGLYLKARKANINGRGFLA
jgi:cytosine/adenosine deaminase-related metal-dependent hydrolase